MATLTTAPRHPPVMSPEALARLGTREVVYIRAVSAADLRAHVDGLDDVPDDRTFFAVHAADGTRVAIMETADAAMAAARTNDMEPLRVH